MYMDEGPGKNYFAWSCALDGTRNADGPAPDGEEYFAMALFFASRRWGDGEGIFNYSREAKAILHECEMCIRDSVSSAAFLRAFCGICR